MSDQPPFVLIEGRSGADTIILCDHASNRVPVPYGVLGLPAGAFERHIAYDIGALHIARTLAQRLGAHLVHTTFTRLLIDPNRGSDDPTLVMRLSDGQIVPGNAGADAGEVAHRIATFHRPYHMAISNLIDRMLARGIVPAIISIHSYTEAWKGIARPWSAAVLWDNDPRLNVPVIDGLRRLPDVLVGDNEPYDGALAGDTMWQHATVRGLAQTLIEVRQDLIATSHAATTWGERLADVLQPLLARPEMHQVQHLPSRTGPYTPV
jgi:predicted N-formylglutamate amidohydrolase